MRPCPQHTLGRSSTLPTLLGLIRGMEVQTVTIASPHLWISLSIPAQPLWPKIQPPQKTSLGPCLDFFLVSSGICTAPDPWQQVSIQPMGAAGVSPEALSQAAPYLYPSPERVALQPRIERHPWHRGQSGSCCRGFPQPGSWLWMGCVSAGGRNVGNAQLQGSPLWGIKAHDSRQER